MENEMMNVLNEVAEETSPATQAIAEEAIVPAAEIMVQDAIKADAVVTAPATGKKHSKLKTGFFIAGLVGIVLFKPVKKAIKNSKEKKEAELQARIDAAVEAKLNAYLEGAKLHEANCGEENTKTEAEQIEKTIDETEENK